MQRKIVTLTFVFAAIFSPMYPLGAAESDMLNHFVLNHLGTQIEQYPVIRTEFTQTKQMLALKRPLITTGQLTYSQSHGVLWQIHQPYRISYVLGEDKIIEIDANGVRKERGVREVPGLAQVGRVFRAMLGANAAELRTYFDVVVQGESNKWGLELKPRQPQLTKFLTKIQLTGGQFIDTIVIDESGGDTATLRFRKTQGVSVLSESELQLFGNSSVKP